jgi:tRNA1(Val) A37 N6-methylase TrmN6
VWRFRDWPEFAVIAETAMTGTVMTETATLSNTDDSNTECSKKELSKKTKETGKPDAVVSNPKHPEKPESLIKDSPPEKAKRHFVPPAIPYTRKQVNDAVESQGCVNIINHKPHLFEELKAFGFRDKYGQPIHHLDGFVNGLEWKMQRAKEMKFQR